MKPRAKLWLAIYKSEGMNYNSLSQVCDIQMYRLYDILKNMTRAGEIRKAGGRDKSVFTVTKDCTTPAGVRAGSL